MASKRQLKYQIWRQRNKTKAKLQKIEELKAIVGLAYYELEQMKIGNKALRSENAALADRLEMVNAQLDEIRRPAPPPPPRVIGDAGNANGNGEALIAG
jgi:hypothetical protein